MLWMISAGWSMPGTGKVTLTFKQRCSASYRICRCVLLLKASKHWQFCKLSTQIYFYRYHLHFSASFCCCTYILWWCFFDKILIHTCFHFSPFLSRLLIVGTLISRSSLHCPLMSFSELSCWVILGTPGAVLSCGERGFLWQRLFFSAGLSFCFTYAVLGTFLNPFTYSNL